jgi:dienelactone hydrolase
MAIFVLVHGAWHGAWCWRRVARVLSQAGHEVFTPGLTGIGERSHLLKPNLNLDTHILDVVNDRREGRPSRSINAIRLCLVGCEAEDRRSSERLAR